MTIYREEVLPEELIKGLYEYFRNAKWSWGHKSLNAMFQRSIPHWSIPIAGASSNNTNYYDCYNDLKIDIVRQTWDTLKEEYFKDDVIVRCYDNAITQGIDKKLNTDDHHPESKTCIIYLVENDTNAKWQADWSGETIIWDKEKRQITESYLPKYNTMLIIAGNSWHGVRPVSSYCDNLRMSLMFKTRKKGTL